MPDPTRAPRTSRPQDEATVSAALRSLVLGTHADELGLGTEDPDRVFGVVIEVGHDGHVVTIAALLDGTASRYVSTGGGTVGAGEHEPVAESARALVAMGQVFVGHCEPTSDYPTPTAGRVRLHLLTVGGGRTADAAEQELGDRRHPLSPVYETGQALAAQIDLLAEIPPG